MVDRTPDPDSDAGPTTDLAAVTAAPPAPVGGASTEAALGDSASGPTTSDAEFVERRQFVRRMSTNAVGMAGSMFGLSRMLSRGAVAAGQAVMTELGGVSEEVGSVPGDEAVELAPNFSTGVAMAAADADPPPAPAEPVQRALSLDADQSSLLVAATSAVVAVNRDGHPPQLTTAAVLWDGRTLRFATLGWSRRATMLRADPRIGFLVDGPDDRFVTVTGIAQIVDGRDAREAMRPLLLREFDGSEEAADDRWTALMLADPDRAVIVVEPDQVLTGRR